MKRHFIMSMLSICLISACSQPNEINETVKEPIDQVSNDKNTDNNIVEPAPLYFEEVEGEKALAQVKKWNKASLDKLTADPRFEELREEALDIVNATDKIAYGSYRGGYVYNFWQTEKNVRGLLRRTSLDSYRSDSPNWETLLDVDALAEKENANWVYSGSTCLEPDYTRCILSFSDGGKDAVERREWNHTTKSFVENGFYIPESKNNVSWVDKDTIIVGTDFGENTLTDSGYPMMAKLLKRGQALDEAKVLFKGKTSDVAAGAYKVDIDDESYALFGYRATSFYDTEYFWLKDDGSQIKLPLPTKASPQSVFKGQMLVRLQENWELDSNTLPIGALVSFDIKQWMEDQTITNAQVVYLPDDKSTLQSASTSKSKIIVRVLENVASKLYAFDFVDGSWSKVPLKLPGTGTMSISSINDDSDILFVNQETFISPDSLLALDISDMDSGNIKIETLVSTPNRFDATDLVVEQQFAESKDGTKVPYFVVRKKDTPFDGSTPTLLYAYGGFQVSLTPSYSGIRGKLWLENGGAYVLANIRGGGEFGPKWHQAGLKTNRQVIYDDMAAVAEAIIDSKLSSPDTLGIMGGSNGGLLMGVMYNQRPDLFNAVVCQVPLLDMLRYHTLLAGASWVGEYGSPEIPEERAFLEKISPLHNVKADVDYPNILFVTSTKDDRVHPGHARKMAYVLEQYGHPFEYYENIDGGHSASANLKEVAKRSALEYTFLMQELMD